LDSVALCHYLLPAVPRAQLFLASASPNIFTQKMSKKRRHAPLLFVAYRQRASGVPRQFNAGAGLPGLGRARPAVLGGPVSAPHCRLISLMDLFHEIAQWGASPSYFPNARPTVVKNHEIARQKNLGRIKHVRTLVVFSYFFLPPVGAWCCQLPVSTCM
jgi:hypothetical protein